MANDDPLAVRNPYLLQPDSQCSIKPIENPRLDLLDKHPRTLLGHLEFVEWVCEEVCTQVDYKKKHASNQSITLALDGIYWAQALTRVRQLPSFLPDSVGASQLLRQIEIVASILQRQLSIRTIEQVAELLLPAVRALRDAAEVFWQEKEPPKSEIKPDAALLGILEAVKRDRETALERATQQQSENYRKQVAYKVFALAFDATYTFNTNADQVDWVAWAKIWGYAAGSLTDGMKKRLQSVRKDSLPRTLLATIHLLLSGSECTDVQRTDILHRLADDPDLRRFPSWMPFLRDWLFPPPDIEYPSSIQLVTPAEVCDFVTREEHAEVKAAFLGYTTGFESIETPSAHEMAKTALPEPEKPIPAKPDGLHPPNILRRGTKELFLEPLAYNLLKYMWQKENAVAEHVVDAVWGQPNEKIPRQLKDPMSHANTALEELGFPWSLGQKGGFVEKRT